MHGCALGQRECRVKLPVDPTNTGDTHVTGEVDEGGDADLRTLDSFSLQNVDLIKIDTEGYEFDIIRGGIDTIMLNRPLMVVEQKGREEIYRGHARNGAVDYLKALGMVVKREISGDYILGWG